MKIVERTFGARSDIGRRAQIRARFKVQNAKGKEKEKEEIGNG